MAEVYDDAAPTSVPQSAPPLIWLVVIAAVSLWWLWPHLSLWVEKRTATKHPASSPLAASSCAQKQQTAAASKQSHAEIRRVDEQTSSNEELLSSSKGAAAQLQTQLQAVAHEDDASSPATPSAGQPLSPFKQLVGSTRIDINKEFKDTFTKAASLIKDALQVAPQSSEYTAATAALHRVADILDRIFQACAVEAEISKVSRLRETSDSFRTTFGEHRIGAVARALLSVAGFERQPEGFWQFRIEDAQAKFCAMSVRLCLQKHIELQRQRGKNVWTQTSNDDVVPQLEKCKVAELMSLFHGPSKAAPEDSGGSWKEKATEVQVRTKVNAYRTEIGHTIPLASHEGLASIARVLANSLRMFSRANGGDRPPPAMCDDEASTLLQTLPLPPESWVVRLEYITSDLPHVFGLSSTTGKTTNDGDSDKAAEIIANEALSTWKLRQADCLGWPYAIACGLGVSLDYTVNQGFVVLFFAGFEGELPEEQLGSAERREHLDMKQRLARAPKSTGPAFGARVHGLSSLRDDAGAAMRRAPPPPRGGGGG